MGAGVMGLTAPTLRLELGMPATIYGTRARHSTTSSVASGEWALSIVNYGGEQEFREILEISYREFKSQIEKGFAQAPNPIPKLASAWSLTWRRCEGRSLPMPEHHMDHPRNVAKIAPTHMTTELRGVTCATDGITSAGDITARRRASAGFDQAPKNPIAGVIRPREQFLMPLEAERKVLRRDLNRLYDTVIRTGTRDDGF